MLAKRFLQADRRQIKKDAWGSISLGREVGELLLHISHFLVDPTFTSNITNVSREKNFFLSLPVKFKRHMTFGELWKSGKIATKLQEALVLNNLYDEAGFGRRQAYSSLYGMYFHYVFIPDVSVYYHWINGNEFDQTSFLSLNPSSRQYRLLQANDYFLNEFNQVLAGLGFMLLEPSLKGGKLVYPLRDLSYSPQLDFTSVEALKNSINESKNSLVFTKDLATKLDHMLISARTGMGKTSLALALIAELAHKNTIFYFLDPKNSDLALFGRFLGCDRYASNTEKINRLIHDLVTSMNSRYAKMREISEKTPQDFVGKTAVDFGFKPVVVVFDEVSAHLSADKSCISDLKQLLMKGRQSGIFVMLILQDPRTSSNLPTTLKDQAGIKVFLGQLTGTISSVVFGSGIDLPDQPRGVGQGYIQVNGGDLQLFDAPKIPRDSGQLYSLMKSSLEDQKMLDPLKIE